MSGCPNGCGQHHLGAIGFYGASIKVGEHTIPAYIPHVGGVFEGGEVQFGQRLKQRLPAKRVPDAVERWIRHYEASREEGEEWGAFVERVGTPELEALVKDLSLPVDFGLETMGQFIDWNRDVPFQVIRERASARSERQRGATSRLRRLRHLTPSAAAARPPPRPIPQELTETLREAVQRHGGGLVLLCSFQKEESVLIDELLRIDRRARGAGRDDRHRRAVRGDAADVASVRGALRDRDRGPGRERYRGERLERPGALLLAREGRGAGARAGGAEAWITGIRREQGPTRADAEPIEHDAGAGIWKYNPLAHGPRRTCGGESTSASCRTTRCTTRATRRSAARPARSPAAAARAAGRGPRRPSAGCTWRPSVMSVRRRARS